MTVIQLADRLRDESDAYLFVEELRWPDGVAVCPHCDHRGATYIEPLNGKSRKTRTGTQSQRRVWRCLNCRKQFSVITGTCMHGTKVPLRIWVLCFFEMVSSKNGLAASPNAIINSGKSASMSPLSAVPTSGEIVLLCTSAGARVEIVTPADGATAPVGSFVLRKLSCHRIAPLYASIA